MFNPSYAVFILVNGQWVQHCAAGDDVTWMKGEVAYLANSLGITARVFRKL